MVKAEKGKSAKPSSLEAALEAITKKHGDGAVIKGEQKVAVDVISTRALPVDVALGVGGIPKGRITEIYGPEASGKTTLALQVVAMAQSRGGVAAYIDAEHSLDPSYMKALGIDLDKLILSQPDYGEQALDILLSLVESNEVEVIVVDSVAALIPKAELDGSMGDVHMGAQARMMSQALRKLNAAVHRSNCAVIFINQLREKIGLMFGGNPETTPGGRALKFYASCRLEIRRLSALKANGSGDDEEKNNIGNRVRVKVVKNKVAPPFKTAEFDIIFGKGVSHTGCLLDYAERYKIVVRRGANYYLGDERIAVGRQQALLFLEQHKDVAQNFESKIIEKSMLKESELSPEEPLEEVGISVE